MADISARWMYVKAVLLLVIGVLAGGLLVMETPTWRTAGLLAVAVWGFCRAYYFAFYVMERWVDPGYRFAGLWGFARYLVRRRPPR